MTFSWTPGIGANSYVLWVISHGVRIYDSGSLTGTSATVSNLPVDGSPLTVGLWGSGSDQGALGGYVSYTAFDWSSNDDSDGDGYSDLEEVGMGK